MTTLTIDCPRFLRQISFFTMDAATYFETDTNKKNCLNKHNTVDVTLDPSKAALSTVVYRVVPTAVLR